MSVPPSREVPISPDLRHARLEAVSGAVSRAPLYPGLRPAKLACLPWAGGLNSRRQLHRQLINPALLPVTNTFTLASSLPTTTTSTAALA